MSTQYTRSVLRGRLAMPVVLGLLSCAPMARAAEFRQTVTPGGTTDIRAAELPPEPGFYALGGLAGVWQDQVIDGSGNEMYPDTFNRVQNVQIGGMYVYPGEVFGGRVASSLVFALGKHYLRVTDTLPVDLSHGFSGLFDAYSDIFFWSRSWYDAPPAAGEAITNASGEPGLPSGFTFAFGLGASIPIGQFDASRHVGSLGFNNWTLSPNMAVTYRTKPILLDATEFSARLFYNHNFERHDSTGGFDYRDGDYISLDFAVTERYSRYQFGMAGNWRQQIEDDSGSPAVPALDGQRFSSLRLGPVLAVDLPEIGAGISFKYLRDVEVQQGFKGDQFQISFIKKLF